MNKSQPFIVHSENIRFFLLVCLPLFLPKLICQDKKEEEAEEEENEEDKLKVTIEQISLLLLLVVFFLCVCVLCD